MFDCSYPIIPPYRRSHQTLLSFAAKFLQDKILLFRKLFFQMHTIELKSYAKIHISYTGLQSLERDTMQ